MFKVERKQMGLVFIYCALFIFTASQQMLSKSSRLHAMNLMLLTNGVVLPHGIVVFQVSKIMDGGDKITFLFQITF